MARHGIRLVQRLTDKEVAASCCGGTLAVAESETGCCTGADGRGCGSAEPRVEDGSAASGSGCCGGAKRECCG